jgi:hypothetical protein
MVPLCCTVTKPWPSSWWMSLEIPLSLLGVWQLD